MQEYYIIFLLNLYNPKTYGSNAWWYIVVSPSL